MVGINLNVRNNSSIRHKKFSFWELTVTVCREKELQTHSRNRVYFQLSLPFFKSVKGLGETLKFGLSKNTKTLKSIFFSQCKHFRSRLHGNVCWGTFLITIERITIKMFILAHYSVYVILIIYMYYEKPCLLNQTACRY